MDIKLNVSSVTQKSAPNDITRFEMRGTAKEGFDNRHIFVSGYVGTTNKTLHLESIPTYNVDWQVAILTYMSDNSSTIIKKVLSKAKKERNGRKLADITFQPVQS